MTKQTSKIISARPEVPDEFQHRGKRSQIICGDGPKGPRTKQSFKEECDINSVMAKWERSGVLGHQNRTVPEYGDFSNVPDYHTAVNLVREAERQFEELPAHIRDRFSNEPAELLAFMDKPINREEAIEMGIIDEDPPGEKPPIPNNSPPPGSPAKLEAKLPQD